MQGLQILIGLMILSEIRSLGAGLKLNNFDFLRFLFAVIVFLVHSYALSAAEGLGKLKYAAVFSHCSKIVLCCKWLLDFHEL